MTEPITNGLKIEELFEEITHVIQNHFKKNMGDFIKRYELLEQTHQQLMKLPSVVNELQLKTINIQHTTNQTENNNQDSSKKEDIVKTSITTVCENENIQFIIKEEPIKTTSYTEPIILSDNEEDTSDDEEDTSDDEDEEEDEDEEDEEEDNNEDNKEDKNEDNNEDNNEDKNEDEDEDEEEIVLDQPLPKVKEDDDEVETEMEEEEDEVETETEEEEDTNLDQPLPKVEEEEELFEIEIDDITYCTNNDETGFIYELSEDGDVGEKVGYFKDSEPFFYADE